MIPSGITHGKWLVVTGMGLPLVPYPGRLTPMVLTSRPMTGAFWAGPRLGPRLPPPRPRALPCCPLGFPLGGAIGICGCLGRVWRDWGSESEWWGEKKVGEGTEWFYRLSIKENTFGHTSWALVLDHQPFPFPRQERRPSDNGLFHLS